MLPSGEGLLTIILPGGLYLVDLGSTICLSSAYPLKTAA